MPKIKNKTVFFLAFSASFAAAAVRCVQVFLFTDYETGFIIKGAEPSMLAFFLLLALSVAFSAFVFFQKDLRRNPIEQESSRSLFICGILCGVFMFYDFVHQCINCYTYASKTTYLSMNYFIPMLLLGVFALLSSVYFVILAISFKTKQYDFKQLRLFHIVPFLWSLFGLFVSLTNYNDKLYAEETFLKYAVLIFALLFFFSFMGVVEKGRKMLNMLAFFGLSYGCLAFSIAVPRIAALVFGNILPAAEFSVLTFLFTGVFSIAVSMNILCQKKD